MVNPGRELRKQLGATAVLLCSLVGRSCGYAAVPGVLAVPNTLTTHSKLYGHGGQFAARSGSGRGSSLLGAAGSRGLLLETVSTLRGGGPAMSFPGFDAAKAAIAAISVPAIAWTGGPALFASVSGRKCMYCYCYCCTYLPTRQRVGSWECHISSDLL